jgi:hypothetical protein
MAELTEQNIRTLIQGGSSVSEIARIYDLTFVNAYEMVVRSMPPKRHLKAGDKYYYLFSSGKTIEEIAESHNSSPLSVTKAMVDMGYQISDELPVENTNRLNFYRIIVDKELASKWNELENAHEKFLDSLSQLEEKVEEGMPLFRSQPPPNGKEVLNLQLPPSIIHRIDNLSIKSITKNRKEPPDCLMSRPKVIRRVLEITTGLFPVDYDRKAKNALGEPQWRTTFYAPVYASRLMREAMGNKGSSNGLTSIFREAVHKILENPDLIDELPKIVVFNTPPHFSKQFAPPECRLVFAHPIPTSLLKRDADALRKLIQTRLKRTRGMYRDFMVALFLWHQGIDQTAIDGWDLWVELCNRAYWEDGDPTIQALINQLIEKNFIILTNR